LSAGEYGIGTKSHRSNVQSCGVAPAWKFGVGAEDSAAWLQQLTEARFLAAFCCAVYGQHDANLVCSTAAQWLYEYFEYQLALFSFVGTEIESVSFRPGSRASERQEYSDVLPLSPSDLQKRGFTFSRNTVTLRGDLSVNFPQGFGNLRILGTKQGGSEPSGDFMQSIAGCLGSALEKALEHKRLQELSLRDGLTGLLNRRAFEELLEIEEERRDAPLQSLIMIDIDNFKAINDSFGHPIGDQVIVGVGGIIRDALRGADLATRYGGEEFAVLLPGTGEADAYAVAERIRSRIVSLRFDDISSQVTVTASLGVASRNAKEGCRLRDLLALADESLYQAKRSGKNTTLIHQGDAPRLY
jgi:two-component system, cell cycle response regulator